jgi:folate-binding protein YgfZ
VKCQEPSAAYAQATSHAGVIDLSTWETLRVTGADRAAFLHNMCTNSIRGLATGGGCEAFFTDVKGKVVAHAFVLAGENEHLLLLSPGQIARLLPHLDRYIICEDVQLADATAEIGWTLLIGPETPALIRKLADDQRELPAANWSHVELHVGGSTVRVVRCDLPWCGGSLLACRRNQGDALRRALGDLGAVICTEADWHTIRIESCWPLYGVDFDNSNLAQECGRDAEAIHLRKGCYLGQETVARIDALGRVNKLLKLIRIDGEPPEPGDEVQADGREAGRVTSACGSPRMNSSLAISMLRHGAGDGETKLTCESRPAAVV